jgi:hypothetical protein
MSLSRSKGIGAKDHGRILNEGWSSLVANQESIREATWEIQAGVKRSGGAEIDTLEVKASPTRAVLRSARKTS